MLGFRAKRTTLVYARGASHHIGTGKERKQRKLDVMGRPVSWSCVKTCVVCGEQFKARCGFTKICGECKDKPCPQCGRLAKKWCNGVCDLCASRNYYKANRESRRQYSRDYYSKNRELVKAKWANYRQMHPDVIKAGTARYTSENKQEILERGKARRELLRLQMVVAYGGNCECCGETEPKFLCIHHVNGDGKVDRANGYGGVSLFAKLRREGWPRERYKLLCHNCNNAIRVVGVCPHQDGYVSEAVNAGV